MSEILRRIELLNQKQQLGLCALIALAIREATTINHQRDEMGFDDIPVELVSDIDELPDDGQLAIVSEVSVYLREAFSNSSHP